MSGAVSGPWIQSYLDLGDHPKVKRLSSALGTSAPTTVGHLHFLWWWCMRYAPDGELGHFTPAEIADAARWEGDPDVLFAELCAAGFIDRDVDDAHVSAHVHDWYDYGGRRLAQMESNRERQQAHRDRKKGVTVTSRLCHTLEKSRKELTHCSSAGADDGACPVDNSEQDTDFAAFWTAYPRKLSKQAALKRWRHLSAADRDAAIVAAGHYARWVRDSGTEKRFVVYPARFLRERLDDWRDGPPEGYGAEMPPKAPECPQCGLVLCYHEDGLAHCPDHGPVPDQDAP